MGGLRLRWLWLGLAKFQQFQRPFSFRIRLRQHRDSCIRENRISGVIRALLGYVNIQNLAIRRLEVGSIHGQNVLGKCDAGLLRAIRCPQDS